MYSLGVMSRTRWYARPAPQFVAAVAVAAIGLVVINPFMANGRIFGREPLATVAFFLPALATIAFLHFAVPREERGSPLRYGLRIFGASALAYALAVVVLVGTVIALTGEFI